MLKRYWYGSGILLLFMVLFSPYLASFSIGSQYHYWGEIWQKNLPAWKINSSFDRGYWNSSGITQISFPLSVTTQSDFPLKGIELIHRIKNGPLIFDEASGSRKFQLATLETHFKLIFKSSPEALALQQQWEALETDPNFIKMISQVGFGGRMETRITGVAKQWNLQTGVLSTGPFEAILWSNKNWDHLQAEWTFPKVSYQESPYAISVEPMSVLSEQYIGSEKLWLGHFIWKLPRVQFLERDQELLKVENYDFFGKVEEKQPMIQMAFDQKLSALKLPKGDYGPGRCLFEIYNLHAKSFRELQEWALLLQEKRGAVDQETILKAYEFGLEILKAKPGMRFSDVKLSTPDGEFSLQAFLEVGGPTVVNLNDRAQLVKSVAGELQISAPQKVIYDWVAQGVSQQLDEEAKKYALYHQGEVMPLPHALSAEERANELKKRTLEQLKFYQDQSYWIEEPGFFNSHIVIRDGVVNMNGKSFPIQ